MSAIRTASSSAASEEGAPLEPSRTLVATSWLGSAVPDHSTRLAAASHDAELRLILLVQLHGLGSVFGPDPDVDHLHEDREAHREVDIPLRDVLTEAFTDERHPDQKQERQREDLDR